MTWKLRLLLPAILLFTSFSTQLFAQNSYTPDLSMSMADFQTQALKEKNEIWVVDFWASWCGPCVRSIPHMKEVAEKFADKQVRFISISWDRNKTQWEAAINRFQMPWQQILIPNIRNAPPMLDKHFPHQSIPSVFLVSPDGKVKKVKNPYNLEDALDKMISKS